MCSISLRDVARTIAFKSATLVAKMQAFSRSIATLEKLRKMIREEYILREKSRSAARNAYRRAAI